MKDEHEKIKKQSYVSFFLSYCIYFYDIWLIHLLIDEITQLGIITVYDPANLSGARAVGKNINEQLVFQQRCNIAFPVK